MSIATTMLSLFAAAGVLAGDYAVTTDGSTKQVRRGATGQIRIAVEPRGSWSIHAEAPFSVRLTAPAALRPLQTEFKNTDAHQDGPIRHVTTTFTAGDAAGKFNVDATLTFFLCSAKVCQRFTARSSVPIEVR